MRLGAESVISLNSLLNLRLFARIEASKPPPRPSAPKPKINTNTPAHQHPSMKDLKDLGDAIEEFNDPEFLKFLQMSGGLPQPG